MKKTFFISSILFIIFSFTIIPLLYAQEVDEITPTPTIISKDNCTSGVFEAVPTAGEGMGTCTYTLLEPIGDTYFIDVGATGGIGNFMNTLFSIIIGIAGVIGIVMLVIYGFQYAANEQSISNFTALREKIQNVILGLLLLLGTFIILRTINPDLLLIDPEIGGVGVEGVELSVETLNYISGIDVSSIKIDGTIYTDPVFLGYLAHQQGAAGAASILWSVNKGYTQIPNKTPFITSSNAGVINKRMRGNIGSDFSKVTGTNVVTPQTFVLYWGKKITAARNRGFTLPGTISSALESASRITGIEKNTFIILCIIESNCNPNARNGSYKGLFQMGDGEFKTHGGKGNIFDPTQNAIAAGNYLKANLNQLNKWKNTINN